MQKGDNIFSGAGFLPCDRNFADNYRYGFQGQESDDELLESVVSFKYRIEDPRLGRFFSVDPLYYKYPWNSNYAFSENRLVDSKELEGMERENATADKIVENYGYEALPVAPVCDGFGDLQMQTYTLKVLGVGSTFAAFKDMFLTNPQHITNNSYANYYVIHDEHPESQRLIGGEIIKIDILGWENNSYVEVHQVVESENYFSMTFLTLYGHTEAGYITFSGVYDEKNNIMVFEIFNSTRSNQGMQSKSCKLDRAAQIDQWEDVIGNAFDWLKSSNDQLKNENGYASWHIEEYYYNEEDCTIGDLDWCDDEEIDCNE